MSQSTIQKKRDLRERRKVRIRFKVSGSTERPRLSVYRSLNHIYAQVIDDASGKTLAAASTLSPELKDGKGKKRELAKEVGSPRWCSTATASTTTAASLRSRRAPARAA